MDSRMEKRTSRQGEDKEQVELQKIPCQRREMVRSREPARRSGRYTSSLLLPGYLLKLFSGQFGNTHIDLILFSTCFLLYSLSLAQYESIHWSFIQSSERHGEGKSMGSLFLFFLFFLSSPLNTLKKLYCRVCFNVFNSWFFNNLKPDIPI